MMAVVYILLQQLVHNEAKDIQYSREKSLLLVFDVNLMHFFPIVVIVYYKPSFCSIKVLILIAVSIADLKLVVKTVVCPEKKIVLFF